MLRWNAAGGGFIKRLAYRQEALRPAALARAWVTALGPGFVLACLLLYVAVMGGHILGDATVYLAAGERLNAGHPLYAISSGDRPVMLQPPFWTVPLVSPPLIAVAWRPLALLPDDLGVIVWWAACLTSILGACAWLLRIRPTIASIGMLVLGIPIAMEIGEGNVNGLILGGTVVLWLFRDRPWSGIILGLLIGLKGWPILLAIWYVGQGHWRTLTIVGLTVVACLATSVVGAGLANNLAYFDVAREVHLSAFSPSWLLGLPWLWVASAVVGSILVVALRARPAASFAIAVATMVFGSPVINPNTYALLLACLASRADVPPSARDHSRPGP